MFTFQSIVCLEESSLCPHFRRAEWGFLLNLPPVSPQTLLWEKRVMNSWSKDSVYIQFIIFTAEFDIVQIRQLIPVYVQILRTYTWKNFVPHLMSSSLVRGVSNSRWMVVKNFLSLRHQAPSCQKTFLGTYCHFLDEIFYRQSHGIWSKVERPLNTVVGERKLCCFTVDWKCIKWECKWIFG